MTPDETRTRGDRRSEIVQATLNLAFEVGPDAVSTSLIAKRLGVSQPAIYKHFRTKDAIWLEVSRQLAARIVENIRLCKASPLAPEIRLRELVLRQLAFISEVPALPDIMVMRHASASHRAIRQRLQDEMAKLRDLMIDLIGQAQERNAIRADIAAADIATLIIGVIQGLVLRMIVSRDTSRMVADGKRLLDLQIGTLLPGRPSP